MGISIATETVIAMGMDTGIPAVGGTARVVMGTGVEKERAEGRGSEIVTGGGTGMTAGETATERAEGKALTINAETALAMATVAESLEMKARVEKIQREKALLFRILLRGRKADGTVSL